MAANGIDINDLSNEILHIYEDALYYYDNILYVYDSVANLNFSNVPSFDFPSFPRFIFGNTMSPLAVEMHDSLQQL